MKREPHIWVLVYPSGSIAWTSSRIAAYPTKAMALLAQREYMLGECNIVKMTPHVPLEKLAVETNTILKKYQQKTLEQS